MLFFSTITYTNGVIILPEFNRFAFQIGEFGLRWYALAYLAGLIFGWYFLRREAQRPKSPICIEAIDVLFNYILFGIIVGGRLGYILFYNIEYYLHDPLATLRVWEGGMAFHGALLGIAISIFIMSKRNKIPFLCLTDRVALVVPIGLFFGRLSNFINGELYGRVTSVPWAMVFPNSDGQPRHPSQLYEAGVEGILLGLVMFSLWRRDWLLRRGLLTGIFLTGYGIARTFIEILREPDSQLGLYFGGLSMGQLLSIPMIIVGCYFIFQNYPLSKDNS